MFSTTLSAVFSMFSTTLATEFVGAVPGVTLIDMLKASNAKELAISTSKNNLLIKAKSADLRFPMLDKEQFI